MQVTVAWNVNFRLKIVVRPKHVADNLNKIIIIIE
jgi:hypothetical protein